MAIRGNLAEAALADVVQLLALGRRTGRLSAARGAELGTICFLDGHVVHAALAHRREWLGAALVRSGALDDADLCAALVEQAADPDTPLGVLLVRRGAVDRDALLAQLAAQTAEAAYELLSWTRGTFHFEADVVPTPTEIAVRLDAGALLLEAARRSDERVVIATEVPGPTAVFAPVPTSGRESTVAAGDAETALLEGISDDEQARVLSAIDGIRDVLAVGHLLGVSEFYVARALYALVRRGRVRRVAAPDTAPAAGARPSAARADEHLNLGVAFARAGLLDEAVREFRRVLELRPADVTARGHLGAVAVRRARWADAAAVLGEAVTLPGVTAATWHALGLARHRLGQLAAAEEAYAEAARRGLADDPAHLTARAALALDRGEQRAARAWLARARELWHAPPAVWFHYAALAALAVGDGEGATTLLETGAAAHPRAVALVANAAALAAASGDVPRAAARASAALAEAPELAATQRLLGDLHYRAGRFAEARRAYESATRTAPDASPAAWARLGTLALRAGDQAVARAAWERACHLDPDHPTARANLDALRRRDAATAS